MILRDYQRDAVDTLHKNLLIKNMALCVLPCGTGKTEIMIEYINRHWSSGQWLVILNRVDLFEQTYRRLKAGVHRASLSPYCRSSDFDLDPGGDIVVGTIQSLINIREKPFQYIIMDEVHNACGKNGRYEQFLAEQINAKKIGFTATPFRVAGGPIYGEDKSFPEITFKKPLQEFIKDKWLVPPKCKGSAAAFDLSSVGITAGEWNKGDLAEIAADETRVRLQVNDALLRTKDRKKLVWFCCNINHAELVKKIIDETEVASIIHSKLSKEDRRDNKNTFEKTECRYLVFVTIVSEGYDYPPVDCVVMMRPTRSAVLYIQTVGRAMRPFLGKEDCLILDYGRVIENLGTIDTPLLLDSKRKKAQEQIDELKEKTKFCPQCFLYLAAPYPPVCPDCGHEFPKPKPKVELKPDQVRDILTNHDWQVLPVADVSVDKFTSKKGNTMFRVKYYRATPRHALCVELLTADVSSYFYSKTLRRMRELDVDLTKPKTSMFGGAYYSAGNLPTEICFRINNAGFNEVKWIDFDKTESLDLESVGEGG